MHLARFGVKLSVVERKLLLVKRSAKQASPQTKSPGRTRPHREVREKSVQTRREQAIRGPRLNIWARRSAETLAHSAPVPVDLLQWLLLHASTSELSRTGLLLAQWRKRCPDGQPPIWCSSTV